MTRRTVNALLVAWLCVTWGAMVAQVDHYPLTWAPMYSRWAPQEVISHHIVDKEAYMRGPLVTRRDGSTGYAGARELNLSRKHMHKLYYSRTSMSRESSFHLFRTLNRTLGHEPDDPQFIVGVQATFERMYRRLDDVSNVWSETQVAKLQWDEAWRERW